MDKILGTAKIRHKGEITIPKEVREFLQLQNGDEISLIWEKGKVTVKKVKTVYEDFTPPTTTSSSDTQE